MCVSWPNPVKLGEMLRQEYTKVKQPTKVKRYHLTETHTQDRLQHWDGFVTSFTTKSRNFTQKRRLKL